MGNPGFGTHIGFAEFFTQLKNLIVMKFQKPFSAGPFQDDVRMQKITNCGSFQQYIRMVKILNDLFSAHSLFQFI